MHSPLRVPSYAHGMEYASCVLVQILRVQVQPEHVSPSHVSQVYTGQLHFSVVLPCTRRIPVRDELAPHIGASYEQVEMTLA